MAAPMLTRRKFLKAASGLIVPVAMPFVIPSYVRDANARMILNQVAGQAGKREPAWLTAIDPVLNADGGGFATYTTVLEFTALPFSGDKLRITFTPRVTAGGNTNLTDTFIGHAATSGNLYDFDGGQQRILWSAGNPIDMAPGTGDVVSDELTFSNDPSKRLLVAFNWAGTGGGIRTNSGQLDMHCWDRDATSEAGTSAKTAGYTDRGTRSFVCEKLELFT